MTTQAERTELRGAVLDGKYRIGDCIGIGGTGVVFEAVRLEDHAIVAIKTLRPCFLDHPDLGNRLRREIEVARAVEHPGIVKVLDEGMLADGSPYVVMERVYGDSLARILMREGTISAAETAAIVIRVAAILHAVHKAGYTHRDIKPEHVLLARAPDGELVVRIFDFGVCASPSAPADERQRELGRVYGTPTYVSPEQASGNPDVDGRADLFSLGIVMFEALAGRVPFRASNVSSLLLRILREDAPRLGLLVPDLNILMDEIVAKCLARDVRDRFQSAHELARALVPHAHDRRSVERRLALRVTGVRKTHDDHTPTELDTAPRYAAAS